MQNSFPNNFIDELIQKKNKFDSEIVKNTDYNKPYITIPYVTKILEKFSKKIKAMFEDIGVKIHIAYNKLKVGNYFSLNDSINNMYRSCLICKFTCPGDLNNQYIGETERQLKDI